MNQLDWKNNFEFLRERERKENSLSGRICKRRIAIYCYNWLPFRVVGSFLSFHVQFNLSKKYLRRVDDGLCHSPLVCDSTTVVNYSSKSVTIHLQSKASGCGTVRSYRLFLMELWFCAQFHSILIFFQLLDMNGNVDLSGLICRGHRGNAPRSWAEAVASRCVLSCVVIPTYS